MKIRVTLFLFVLGLSIPSISQTTYWKWGTSHCMISNPVDSAFLVDVEKKMWKAALEKNSFNVFEGFGGGNGYYIRVSRFGVEHAFADTTVAKLNFTNVAELLSLWNTNADTCWIIGYQPMVIFERNHRWYQERDWKYKTCYLHVPLYRYSSFLAAGDESIAQHDD